MGLTLAMLHFEINIFDILQPQPIEFSIPFYSLCKDIYD